MAVSRTGALASDLNKKVNCSHRFIQARLEPGEVMPSLSAGLCLSSLSSQRWLDAQATICLVVPHPRSTFLATVMLSSIWTLVLITLKH